LEDFLAVQATILISFKQRFLNTKRNSIRVVSSITGEFNAVDHFLGMAQTVIEGDAFFS
jgi:hypothetical protein